MTFDYSKLQVILPCKLGVPTYNTISSPDTEPSQSSVLLLLLCCCESSNCKNSHFLSSILLQKRYGLYKGTTSCAVKGFLSPLLSYVILIFPCFFLCMSFVFKYLPFYVLLTLLINQYLLHFYFLWIIIITIVDLGLHYMMYCYSVIWWLYFILFMDWFFFLGGFQELQINFSQYEHPVILTVEEGVKIKSIIMYYVNSIHIYFFWFLLLISIQEKYVGNLGGGLSKNLFLKVISVQACICIQVSRHSLPSLWCELKKWW